MAERDTDGPRRGLSHNAPSRPTLPRKSILEEQPAANPGPSSLSRPHGVSQDDSTRSFTPTFSKHQPFSTHVQEHEILKERKGIRGHGQELVELDELDFPVKMRRDGPTRLPFPKGKPSTTTYRERQARMKRKQLGKDIPRVTRDDSIRPRSLRRSSPPTFTPLSKEYLAYLRRTRMPRMDFDDKPRVINRPPVLSEEEEEEEEESAEAPAFLETDLDAEEIFEEALTDGNDGEITAGESSNTIDTAASTNQLVKSKGNGNHFDWFRGLLSGIRLRNAREARNDGDIESGPMELENTPMETVDNNGDELENGENGPSQDTIDLEIEKEEPESTKKRGILGWLSNPFGFRKDGAEKEVGGGGGGATANQNQLNDEQKNKEDATDIESGEGDSRTSAKKKGFFTRFSNTFGIGNDAAEGKPGIENDGAPASQPEDQIQPGPSGHVSIPMEGISTTGNRETSGDENSDSGPATDGDERRSRKRHGGNQNGESPTTFPNRRIDDVMDAEQNDEPLFAKFLNALYYAGMNPYYYGSVDNTRRRKICAFLQKVRFILVTFLGVLHSVEYVKDQVMFSPKGQSLQYFYIDLAYFVNTLILRCFHVGIMFWKKNILWDLVMAIRSWKFTNPTNKKLTWMILIATFMSSTIPDLLYAIIDSIFTYGGSPSKILTGNSANGAGAVLNWDKDSNATSPHVVSIRNEYGGNLTPMKAAIGGAYMSKNVSGEIQHNLIRDIPLYCAAELLVLAKDFKELLLKKRPGDLQYFQEVWQKYKTLRLISSLMNQAFGLLFQLVHVDFVLFFTDLLYKLAILMEVDGQLPFQIVQAIKICIFYVAAAEVSDVNETFRTWSQDTFTEGKTEFFEEDGKQLSTANLFDQISTRPVGLGKNPFHIAGAFIFKLASVIGSFFVFFLDTPATDT